MMDESMDVWKPKTKENEQSYGKEDAKTKDSHQNKSSLIIKFQWLCSVSAEYCRRNVEGGMLGWKT